ncbi:MAG: flagellar hook-basal body complex protein FliE [Candidatus Omnitrophica bacterium]|nr:flagellar hook-basal body complex protein FliE [Candidatus Omnitrophota bacterium]
MNEYGIAPIRPIALPISPDAAAKIASTDKESFAKLLSNSLKQIDEMNKGAEQAMENLAAGELQDVHQVMLAMEKANLSFMTMMQVRNKLVQAYNEVMRMQF